MPEIRQDPIKLAGDLWGVTTWFNLRRHPLPLQNLQTFCRRVREQGLKLLIVELAFGDAPFELHEDLCDLLIRRRTQTVLWQKERMLNLGIAHLPPACDKVAWLDGDLIFENDDWVAQTSQLLESYVVVQPYETACWLPRDTETMPADAQRGIAEGRYLPGMVRGLSSYATDAERNRALGNYLYAGHTGFAWSARRSLLERHGLYDRDIAGGGDVAIAHSLLGDEEFWQGKRFYCRWLTANTLADIARWGRAVHQDVAGSIAWTPGRVLHLWHGSIRSRHYTTRLKILHNSAFDACSDLAIDETGCWRWNSDKPILHDGVRDYLAARTRSLEEEVADATAG